MSGQALVPEHMRRKIGEKLGTGPDAAKKRYERDVAAVSNSAPRVFAIEAALDLFHTYGQEKA